MINDVQFLILCLSYFIITVSPKIPKLQPKWLKFESMEVPDRRISKWNQIDHWNDQFGITQNLQRSPCSSKNITRRELLFWSRVFLSDSRKYIWNWIKLQNDFASILKSHILEKKGTIFLWYPSLMCKIPHQMKPERHSVS